MKIDLADSMLIDVIKSNYSDDPIMRRMQQEIVCQLENSLLSLDNSIDLCNNTINETIDSNASQINNPNHQRSSTKCVDC